MGLDDLHNSGDALDAKGRYTHSDYRDWPWSMKLDPKAVHDEAHLHVTPSNLIS